MQIQGQSLSGAGELVVIDAECIGQQVRGLVVPDLKVLIRHERAQRGHQVTPLTDIGIQSPQRILTGAVQGWNHDHGIVFQQGLVGLVVDEVAFDVQLEEGIVYPSDHVVVGDLPLLTREAGLQSEPVQSGQ